MSNQTIKNFPPEALIRMFNTLDAKGCSRTADERILFHQLWNELEGVGLISYTTEYGYQGPN